jgi:hypothetical protein
MVKQNRWRGGTDALQWVGGQHITTQTKERSENQTKRLIIHEKQLPNRFFSLYFFSITLSPSSTVWFNHFQYQL